MPHHHRHHHPHHQRFSQASLLPRDNPLWSPLRLRSIVSRRNVCFKGSRCWPSVEEWMREETCVVVHNMNWAQSISIAGIHAQHLKQCVDSYSIGIGRVLTAKLIW